MAKRTSALQVEARERARAQNAAKLRAVEELVDSAAAVFEVEARRDGLASKEEAARERAREKYERELARIDREFEEQREALLGERDESVAAMFLIEAVTVKDVASAVDLSAAEVRRIKKSSESEAQQAPRGEGADDSAGPGEGTVSGQDQPWSAQ